MGLRAILVMLLALNAGAALWWAAQGPARAQPPPAVPPGLLVLEPVAPASPTQPTTAPPVTPLEPPAASAVAVPTTASTLRCYRFGPFASAEAAFTARVALLPDVARLVAREQPPTRGRGWRVVVPPQPTAEAAVALAERIRAAGFADLFVMREGVDANAIALGRFGAAESARKHARALRAAGFGAVAEPLGGRGGQTWLDVVAVPGFDPVRVLGTTGASQQRAIDCSSLG